jgi:predicted nucleotidyltransferase
MNGALPQAPSLQRAKPASAPAAVPPRRAFARRNHEEGDFMQYPEVVEKIVSVAKNDEAILELFIFGSYARGEETIFSDVDIAVIHGESGEINRAALNEATAQHDEDVQFTYIKTDVFYSDDHPLHVSSSVQREGVRLWQR